jgi:uncharacterized protein (TIGR03435 family)
MVAPGANGAIRATNVPLRLLIRAAYKLEDEQITGGPPWQLSTKFDITAKPGDGAVATEDALRERLRALLADRFKLRTHTEKREMTVSALVVKEAGKLGPNLKPSTADCSNAQAEAQKAADEIRRNPANALSAMSQIKCGIVPVPTPGANGAPPQLVVRGMGQPVSNLVSLLTQFTGRQVVDKTALTGLYDFEPSGQGLLAGAPRDRTQPFEVVPGGEGHGRPNAHRSNQVGRYFTSFESIEEPCREIRFEVLRHRASRCVFAG